MSLARASAALAVAAALALGGCGGGSGGAADDAKSAAESYFAALGSGDAAKACGLLSDEVRQAFVQRIQAQTNTSDCATGLKKLLDDPGGKVVKTIAKDAQVKDVKVSGDTATAKLRSAGYEAGFRMRKQGGGWKVDQPPSQ